MSRKNKITILIISGLLVIFLLSWFLIMPQVSIIDQGLNTNTSSLPQTDNKATPAVNPTTAILKTEEPKSDVEIAVKSLTSAFCERYGSFSNQTDFKNLRDLAPLMTDKFSAQSDEYIKEQKKKQDTTLYYGITSKTVKNRLISLDEKEGVAVVSLTMQRREASGAINSNVKIFYQDIAVELKKEREEWKVDSAEWQK